MRARLASNRRRERDPVSKVQDASPLQPDQDASKQEKKDALDLENEHAGIKATARIAPSAVLVATHKRRWIRGNSSLSSIFLGTVSMTVHGARHFDLVIQGKTLPMRGPSHEHYP